MIDLNNISADAKSSFVVVDAAIVKSAAEKALASYRAELKRTKDEYRESLIQGAIRPARFFGWIKEITREQAEILFEEGKLDDFDYDDFGWDYHHEDCEEIQQRINKAEQLINVAGIATGQIFLTIKDATWVADWNKILPFTK